MRATLAFLLALAACFMFSADATYGRKSHFVRSPVRTYRKSVVAVPAGKFGARFGGGAFGGAVGGGVDVGATLQKIQWQLKQVGKRGCITGNVQAVICDPNNYDDAYCTYKYVGDGYDKIVEILVDYDDDNDDDFDDLPVVTSGLSGINGEGGKDCEVEATYITKKGFKLKLTLGGILPFELNLFWIACDARKDK